MALVAVIFALFAAKPAPANAAPPTGDKSSIPTAPGAKPTPDPNDDPCQLTSCTPTVTSSSKPRESYALPGKNGKQTNQKQDPNQTQKSTTTTKDEEGAPPDLIGALTGETSCVERPHVEVPKTGGRAAGKCVPVSAFGAMGESKNNSASLDSDCALSPVACGKESGGSTGYNGAELALATQFNFVWEAYLLTVNVAAWFTDWAVSFRLFGELSGFAESLRNTWDKQVIGQIGLGGIGGFILGVAVVWAGLLMLFHRFRRGFAELLVSVLIAVIASTFILHTGDAMHKTMNGARYFGLTVASITSDPGGSPSVPNSPEEADRVASRQVGNAVSDKLVTSVLVKPHMIANTGQVQGGACERRYWEMLAAQGDERSAAYERFTSQKSCVKQGALKPTVQRILVATLLLIMAVIVCAFCLLTAGLLLLSQVAAAGYLAVAGIVGMLAPLPGWGRSLLGKWITGLLVAIAGMIASVLIVVVYLNVLGLILGLGQSPLANFAIAIIVAIAGFKLRKRLTAGFRNRARQIGAKLEGTLHRPGGETLIERQQRRHTSVSRLETAAAVAGAPGQPGNGDDALPVNGSNDKRKPVGFGARVRNAMGQTRHGRLAMETASGSGKSAAPLPSGQSAAIAGGLAGVAAVGVARGSQTAQRTARAVKSEVIDATTPSGSIVSSARASRTASKVSGSAGADSSSRAKELIAEMKRRQQEREQELSRRGFS